MSSLPEKLLLTHVARSVIRPYVESYVARHATAKQDKKHIAQEIHLLLESAVGDFDQAAFDGHVQEAVRWASIYQEQGMPGPVDIDGGSVALSYTPAQRRFRSSDDSVSQLTEDDVFSSDRSTLVLGDPGSGKTTTLKRLTLSLLDEASTAKSISLDRPLLLICRSVEWDKTTVVAEVLRRLGIDAAKLGRLLEVDSQGLVSIAAQLLDSAKCLLLVDGLDEIPEAGQRSNVCTALVRFWRQTNEARIVCSARSGEAPHLEGFDVVELLPLSATQIDEIALTRLGAVGFIAQAAEAGIDSDLLDRPLFLNQLLTVYGRSGTLPERPVDLYQHLLRLLIHDWDEQRFVRRTSKYRDFDSGVKQQFLAAMAYELTSRRQYAFTEGDLQSVYETIRERFGLPKSGSLQVVREVESHVGIVVETHVGFQFSHLTMQEFLAADHISRSPLNDKTLANLRTMPAVVAVAVALSGEPTEWLVDCGTKVKDRRSLLLGAHFVRRLALEKPRFTESEELGRLMLRLMSDASSEDELAWQRLSRIAAVKRSVNLCTKEFTFRPDGSMIDVIRTAAVAKGRSSVFFRIEECICRHFELPVA